jgi:hypothetical protein
VMSYAHLQSLAPSGRKLRRPTLSQRQVDEDCLCADLVISRGRLPSYIRLNLSSGLLICGIGMRCLSGMSLLRGILYY